MRERLNEPHLRRKVSRHFDVEDQESDRNREDSIAERLDSLSFIQLLFASSHSFAARTLGEPSVR